MLFLYIFCFVRENEWHNYWLVKSWQCKGWFVNFSTKRPGLLHRARKKISKMIGQRVEIINSNLGNCYNFRTTRPGPVGLVGWIDKDMIRFYVTGHRPTVENDRSPQRAEQKECQLDSMKMKSRFRLPRSWLKKTIV